MTNAVRTLEEKHAQTQASFARAEALRLALWRMDGWMTPRLAREAARPVNEYAAFFSPLDPVNKLLQSVAKGEVLTPSPLLLSSPEWIPIHFEVRADGSITSPQVPEGNLLDLAEGQYFEKGVPIERARTLKRLAELLGGSKQSLEACAVQAELSNASIANAWTASVQESKGAIDDYATRAKASNEAQQFDEQRSTKLNSKTMERDGVAEVADADLSTEDSVGPLVPAWLSTDPPELAFIRRVRERGESRVQGFLVDWSQLSTTLLAQVADLANNASLVPAVIGIEAFAPTRLASFPAELRGDFFVLNGPTASNSSTPALFFAWGAAILALAAAALAAWTSISFGDRQARFASSVTHELRTPLTTFQLYAEMLRDGMVTDETRRKECLDTLCRESVRLSHLVENVLSLSQLERGARPDHMSSMLDAIELTRLVEATAAERAGAATCRVHNELADASIRIDREALTQILANLIENAAKYGRVGDEPASIEIQLTAADDTLVIRVRDHGTGIPPRAANAIWRPFDRAGREGGTQFGLGLGLPVSRALAEGMGGSLQLLGSVVGTSGACFELRVPSSIA